uniref:Uncharacterized protein n=1 Tax=Anguilla anguilla TaxID=7936 RepID=A0A0E9Q3U6_ANGAN
MPSKKDMPLNRFTSTELTIRKALSQKVKKTQSKISQTPLTN